MVDNTGDWCFEGGCTFLTDAAIDMSDDLDTDELEAMYAESCEGKYD